MRKTILGKFPNSDYFDISNFQLNNKIAIEMQVYIQNFKPREKDSWTNSEYLFKLIGIYKFYNIKASHPFTLKKRQKEANK